MGDHYVELVSSVPKTYEVHSALGHIILKSKGFQLNYKNLQIVHMKSLIHQVIDRAWYQPIDNLVLHKGEMQMTHNLFSLEVSVNQGNA